MEEDLELDLDVAVPTPRSPALARGAGRSVPTPRPPATSRPSETQVGTEFEPALSDGRVDTTGLELEEIDDSEGNERRDDELELSIPTAWTRGVGGAPSSAPPPRPNPSPVNDEVGEELDLSGLDPTDSEAPSPVAAGPAPATAHPLDPELDRGVSARALSGVTVLDQAERVRQAHSPPEPQLTLPIRRHGDEELEIEQLPVPQGTLVPETEPGEMALRSHAPPPPLYGGPRPAPLHPAVSAVDESATELDLDAVAAEAGNATYGEIDLGDSSFSDDSGGEVPIGMDAHAAELQANDEAALQLISSNPPAAPSAPPGLQPDDEAALQLISSNPPAVPSTPPVLQPGDGAALRLISSNPPAGPSTPPIAVRVAPDSIVPELDVPVRTSSRPPAATTQLQQDVEANRGGDLSIDLAEAPRPHLRKRSLPPPDRYDPDLDHEDPSLGPSLELANAVGTAPSASASGRPPPSCRTPEVSELEVPTDQIAKIAGYGTPAGALGAPVYALRVALRRRELRRELSHAQRVLMERERNRDAALADIFVTHRDRLQSDEQLSPELAALRGRASNAAELKQDIAEANQEYQRRQRELRLRRSHAEEIRKARAETEVAREHVYQKCEGDYNRVAARFKRLQIEHRNLEVQLRQVSDAGQRQKLATHDARIQGELSKLLPQAQRLFAALESARRDLQASQQEARRAAGQVQVIDAELKATDAWYAKQTSGLGKSVAEAEAIYTMAQADVVRAALSVGTANLDGGTLARLRDEDDRIHDLAFAAHRIRLAIDAYDTQAYRQGVLGGLVLAAGVALVLVFLLLVQ